MTLKVDRENGIPLYVQLREQIAGFINSGLWHPGFKLPTERQLADVLNVSRNTISLAYKGLAEEGLVESQQGRGTFVTGGHSARQPQEGGEELPQQHLELLTDSFLQRILDMGFDLSTVEQTVQRRIDVRRAMLSEITVAFIECNREQLDYFSRSLQLGAGVTVIPLMLSRLINEETSQQVRSQINSMDLVVTTFFHLQEVRSLLGDDVEVVGIALDPEMETMVRIAQLPQQASVGLLCLSETFAERVLKSLGQSGLDYLDIRIETSVDRSAVCELVRSCDALVVSPGRRQEAECLADGDQTIIEFIYKPDAGSINTLQNLLLDSNELREE